MFVKAVNTLKTLQCVANGHSPLGALWIYQGISEMEMKAMS